MNTYSRKLRWKLTLIVIAVLIGAGSLWYTNNLVNRLSEVERKKIELWAQAEKELQNVELGEDLSPIVYNIIKGNKTIPVIEVDEEGNIFNHANFDEDKASKESYLKEQLEIMKNQHDPIEIQVGEGSTHYIYYKDSTLLNKLFYFPFIQLGVIALFIVLAYFAFSSTRAAEQNQVWVGLSKETAHQLGTPISSLFAWLEVLKMKIEDKNLVMEVEKDINRLQKITERFSKIGNPPDLELYDIPEVLQTALNYLKSRTSDKVTFELKQSNGNLAAPMNPPLFEWVIENLCKNAVDAMNGRGRITISVFDQIQVLYIDITDTGRGISKSHYKSIFKPGFTSKNKGWGLGLSLAKRIIETYHNGKIFVKNSEIDTGTTMRIVLKK